MFFRLPCKTESLDKGTLEELLRAEICMQHIHSKNESSKIILNIAERFGQQYVQEQVKNEIVNLPDHTQHQIRFVIFYVLAF